MTHLITGGAGCIGSELAAALLACGEKVRVLDNLSSGRQEHVPKGAEFIYASVRNPYCLVKALDGIEMVWHLAAKTDIKFIGHYDFDADYDDNLQATWGLLSAMRERGINRFAFASSAAVYGEADVITEDMPLAPVSMYGATKLACEAIIRVMALRAGIQSWIFRYCSIVSGKARTSGNMVIPDFIHKLQKDPTRLEIYGDGNQTKPSLHVSECVDAMQFIVEHCKDQVSVHNIGAPDAISVRQQAYLVYTAMKLSPELSFTGGAGGWPGDVPSFRMDVSKLAALGWKTQMTSEQACRRAIKELLESGE